MKFFLEGRSLFLAFPSQGQRFSSHRVCGERRRLPEKSRPLIPNVKLGVRDAERPTIKSHVMTNKNRWNEVNYVRTCGTKYEKLWKIQTKNNLVFYRVFSLDQGIIDIKGTGTGTLQTDTDQRRLIRWRQHGQHSPERCRRPLSTDRHLGVLDQPSSWRLALTSGPWAGRSTSDDIQHSPTSDPSAPNPPTDTLEDLGGAPLNANSWFNWSKHKQSTPFFPGR